jgi:hypothetical protein
MAGEIFTTAMSMNGTAKIFLSTPKFASEIICQQEVVLVALVAPVLPWWA